MSLLRPIALGLIGLSTGFAQNETPPGVLIPPSNPPGTPAIPAVPTPAAPGARPAAPQAAVNQVPLAEQKITETILEPKLSGSRLADLYYKYTGRRVIVSGAAAQAEFSFVQSASPQNPITYAYAAELLRKAATIENFVFVPDATDPNLDILTTSTGGLNGKTRGLPVFTESDTLPQGDAVISYVMSLQYLKPDEAVRTFTSVIGQFGASGSIAPVTNAAAVVITENTSLIRKLIDLKKEIDKPSSQVATRFIRVEFADVTELATTLNTLLAAQQQTKTSAGVQRSGNPAPVPNGAALPEIGGASSGEDTPIQIVPDPRTNRLFAMGRPVDLLFIEGLVREFDTQSDQRNFLRRKLRFLKVSEFLPIARNALTRAFSGTGDPSASGAAGGGAAGGGAGGANRSGANNTNRNNASTGGNRANTSSSSGSFGGGGSGGLGGSGGSGASGGSALSAPNVSTAPESDLVGRTLLVADNITNSLVVQGPPAGVEIIEKLLNEIDVKPDQVMISCVFGQLTLTDGYNFGVDYVATMGRGSAARGGSGSSVNPIDLSPNPAIPGTTTTNITAGTSVTTPGTPKGVVFDPGSLASAIGLGLYGRIGNNLNIYLNAKQTDTNFKVLSRPTIFTANNQKGSIVSGTQIAVPTSSYTSGTSSSASTNFEYKDVALQLEVVPLINSEKEVTLQIYLTSDDIGQNRQVGTGDSSYTIPDILKRELITTVTVPNHETVVLGGLITETTNDSRSGIPILSRIPIIGSLFGSKSRDKNRSELLVFIQPSIVHNDHNLNEVQIDMDSHYKTSGDTRRFADGPGVLPPLESIPNTDKSAPARQAVIVDPKAKPAVTLPSTRFRGH